MIQSPNGNDVISKVVTMLTARMCLLFLLLSSALLVTGCATNVSPEDRATFYSGWVNPNAAAPPTQ